MKKAKGLFTAELGEIIATIKILQDYGVTVEHLKRIRSDKNFAKLIGEFIGRDGFLSGLLHYEVRKIMRSVLYKRMWGPEEWTEYFGLSFTDDVLNEAMKLPFNLDFLQSKDFNDENFTVAETHFLFWVPPNFNLLAPSGRLFTKMKVKTKGAEWGTLAEELITKPIVSGWYLGRAMPRIPQKSDVKVPEGYEQSPLALEICRQNLFMILNQDCDNIGRYSCVCKEELNGTKIAFSIAENGKLVNIENVSASCYFAIKKI